MRLPSVSIARSLLAVHPTHRACTRLQQQPRKANCALTGGSHSFNKLFQCLQRGSGLMLLMVRAAMLTLFRAGFCALSEPSKHCANVKAWGSIFFVAVFCPVGSPLMISCRNCVLRITVSSHRSRFACLPLQTKRGFHCLLCTSDEPPSFTCSAPSRVFMHDRDCDWSAPGQNPPLDGKCREV